MKDELMRELGDRLLSIEIDVVPVTYYRSYPALGVHYKDENAKDIEPLVQAAVARMVHEWPLAKFAQFLAESEVNWTEASAQLIGKSQALALSLPTEGYEASLDFEKCTRLLSTWRGGFANLWEYTITHGRLVIRLVSESIPGNLHIICGDCRRISGPTVWTDAEFALSVKDNDDGHRLFSLSDSNAGFEVICGIVVTKRNVPPVFRS
jgi:hypothetical protein